MMKRFALLLFAAFACGVALLASSSGRAADSARSPFNPDDSDFADWAPKLVDDAVMPSGAEVDSMRRWIRESFDRLDKVPTPAPSDGVEIVVERQDYSSLQFGATCVGDAFEIAGETFDKGLGTHANSRLAVYFPEKVVAFKSRLGIAAKGVGSVQGVLERDGKEIWRSETIRAGEKAAFVAAKFEPTDKLVLIVDATEDGPNSDQANWLDPIAVGASGREYSLCDEGFVRRLRTELPFSFQLGGASSRKFLDSWNLSVDSESVPGRVRYSWTDPKTKLTVVAEVRSFEKFAAADWVLYFTNNGDADSPIVSDVRTLDATFDFGPDVREIPFHTLSGDSMSENSWRPVKFDLGFDEPKTFAPVGGRSSNNAFPFWNVMSRNASDRARADGIFFAVGWTGQWNASFARSNENGTTLVAQAGMERIATILHPGESMRSPRVLVMPWSGDRQRSQALFRRALMFEYAPKLTDRPLQMEFIAQDFDRYFRKRPGWEKIDQQILTARKLKEVDGTAYWFDAAWFPVGFPNGVGNWFFDPENFPNGVQELGDALKELGLKFVLWFEPERVAPETEIATKYPQYVFGGEKGGLYKLNDPEARAFLTDLLLKRIKEYKLDVYRNDFNIDPLSYWRANDEPDRVGMTEIRYVEGLYEMWNAFRNENPGLWIDNCSSGGRRIDLETIQISAPLWRTDACCWPGHPEWDQQHTLGIAQYVPLYSCVAWDPSPYTFRSAANLGAIMQYNFLDDDYDKETTIKSVREAKAYQKFWYGDFYPLTESKAGKESTLAWQLHRPDLDAGLIYFFRQTESPYPTVEVDLREIDPNATYRVAVRRGYEIDSENEISGKDLVRFELTSRERGSACVVEYEKLK